MPSLSWITDTEKKRFTSDAWNVFCSVFNLPPQRPASYVVIEGNSVNQFESTRLERAYMAVGMVPEEGWSSVHVRVRAVPCSTDSDSDEAGTSTSDNDMPPDTEDHS